MGGKRVFKGLVDRVEKVIFINTLSENFNGEKADMILAHVLVLQ